VTVQVLPGVRERVRAAVTLVMVFAVLVAAASSVTT
jgi:hypothetical protein